MENEIFKVPAEWTGYCMLRICIYYWQQFHKRYDKETLTNETNLKNLQKVILAHEGKKYSTGEIKAAINYIYRDTRPKEVDEYVYKTNR